MKKNLLLFSLVALLYGSSYAQKNSSSESDGELSFGVKAGLTVPNFSYSSALGTGFKVSPLLSYYIGATMDVPLSDLWSVEPGFLFVNKGTKLTYANGVVQEISPMYLELPVHLIAKIQAGPGKFIVGAGPYVSLGVGGKNKLTYPASFVIVGSSTVGSANNSNTDLKFGANNGTTIKDKDLQKWDFGLNFILAYKFRSISLQSGYSFGLTNLSPNTYAGTPTVPNSKQGQSIKNGVFSVGLAYSF